MNLQDILQQRRDTRHFTSDPVPEEVLQKALAAAHLAPSVGLSEATRFYMIKEEAVKQSIYSLFEEENRLVKKSLSNHADTLSNYSNIKLQAILDTPVGMIVTTDYSVLKQFTIGVSGTADTLQWSSVCAVQNLWLSLTEQGYSLGWVSILNYNKLKSMLQLPAHEFPLGYFCIGKPATDYNHQPMLEQIGWKEKKANPVVKEIRQIASVENKTTENASLQTCIYSTHENDELRKELIHQINHKTKPPGALGLLEDIALQVGLIQQCTKPTIAHPHIVVFAGDHGIAATGLINPYPQAVTAQMVRNFLNKGAAINVFCQQNNIHLKVVDAGVNYVWNEEYLQAGNFFNYKMGYGTRNYLEQAATTEDEVLESIARGKKIVNIIFEEKCNCIGFGEMGIGNTSSAALIMSAITGISIDDCTGRGTGVNNEQLQTKIDILKKVFALHQLHTLHHSPVQLLVAVGGYEIAMMVGAYLQAASNRMIIVVDGFIATAALLLAIQIQPEVKQYCIFAHNSEEKGHKKMLDFLQVKPLLNLGLRLGEGTAAALAVPLIKNAVAFLNDMASFESAGVSGQQ